MDWQNRLPIHIIAECRLRVFLMVESLKIVKILNNNAAVCSDGTGTEKIVMGRGLAFQQKTGSIIDTNRIEKIFTLHNKETSSHFQEIIQNIPVEHILLAERIISHAKQICKKELHDSIYITLSDHISASLYRAKQNIELKNPLAPSIKRLYHEEYRIAEDALQIIADSVGVQFPEDEAAFLTMHFINAELGAENRQINKIVTTTEKAAGIVLQYLEQDIDDESLSWQRFVTHMSFLIQRLLAGKDYSDKSETPIFDMLVQTYPAAYECTKALKSFLENEFQCIIGKEEQSYLTIHISKLQNEFGIPVSK